METTEFVNWLKSIKRLSRSQRDKLREKINGKAGKEKTGNDVVLTLIKQRLNNKPVCPHCKETELYRWGKSNELQRYRCRQCNRTFNAFTGTPLERLRHKDKWLKFEQTMNDGLSLRKSASVCGIAVNTSFKWRHRFLQLPATTQSDEVGGKAEVNETNFMSSFKGYHHLPKTPQKNAGNAAKRNFSKK